MLWRRGGTCDMLVRFGGSRENLEAVGFGVLVLGG